MKKTDDEKLLKAIMPSFILDLLRFGLLDKADLNDKVNFRQKVRKIFEDNEFDFSLVVDHRSTLKQLADELSDKEQEEVSFVLYATVIEHTLNAVIKRRLNDLHIPGKYLNEILKVSLRAKCTWIFSLMQLKPLSDKHVTSILQIAEARNSFLHYKWKSVVESDDEADTERTKSMIAQAKRTITYLAKYLSALEYNGTKNKINELLNL